MARPLRINSSDGWYHVTARGNERREIFRDDPDRARFLKVLAEMLELYAVRLHAYVLMRNHYHLLVETPEANLSRALQWLNVSYSQGFNRRHQRSGHFLQGRFQSIVVDPQRWGLELSRYLHLNPIRVPRPGLGKPDRQRHRQAVGRPEGQEAVAARLEALRAYGWGSLWGLCRIRASTELASL